MIKGQQIADLAQHGFHYITAITKPQIEKLLRTGTLQMDLFDQAVAEVLADEGLRYVLRRNPVRAQEVRATRHAKLATLQAQVAKANQYLTDHPRAKAPGAVQKLVARAQKLRLADWVELTLEERSITLTVNVSVQQDEAKLDGCYVLKTDLTPHQAKKRLCMTATKIWRRSSMHFGPAKQHTSKCARSSYAAKPEPEPMRSSSCSPIRSSTI